MSNLVAPQSPPFFFTYWNPFSENSNLIEDWFSYVKNVTLARYAADSIGRYIQETSADQIQAIDATGKKICGELYTGFSALEKQLGLVSNQLTEISDSLQGIDSRLGLLVDEAKTSNLLLENVAELLRIPESQKQRQYHIEMGLKFLKNALKDEDLYQDALTELLDAEKLMPSDYFVLHRIGMIYFFVPALGNLEKAAEYFTRAGKYAAVESDPNAARLSNILNKRVNKRFGEQEDSSSHEIAEMAAESYLQAGAALYALGRFEEAAKMAEKAVKQQPEEPKHRFFSAKYLTRAGKPDAAVSNLQKAVELVPAMALAAVGDFDLNKAQPILDLLNHLDAEVCGQLQRNIKTLRDWPQNGYRHQEVQQLATDSQDSLEKINYAEKISLLAKLKEWDLRLPFIGQLVEIAAIGISFNDIDAVQLLRQNSPENAERIWAEKIFKGFCLFPKLQNISVKANPTFIERVLLATANGQFIPYEDENLIKQCIEHLLTPTKKESVEPGSEGFEVEVEANISTEHESALKNHGIISVLGKTLINLGLIYPQAKLRAGPFNEEGGLDEEEDLIQQCIEVIRSERKASVSLLQRRLRLGYTRAARIMDELENRGIVGPSKGAEPRDILSKP